MDISALPLEVTRRPRGPNKPKEPDSQPRTVRVSSVFGRFVDLLKDVEITGTPKEVEWHPWLQSNIDAGKLKLED